MTAAGLKSTLALLLLVTLAAGAPAAADGPTAPSAGPPLPLAFDPPSVDFGVLPPAGKGDARVRLWNTGKKPVTIAKSGTSCGCTVADDLTGRTIQPGQATEFDVTMSMKSGLGDKLERVFVKLEGFGEAYTSLDMKAVVALPVKATPPYLDAMAQSSGVVAVESLDKKPFKVLRAQGRAPVFVGFDPKKDPPRARYDLRWDVAPLVVAGKAPWFWVVETDRADAPVVDVRIRHASTKPDNPPGRAWVPLDQRALVGVVRNGTPFEVLTGLEHAAGQAPQPSTVKVTSLTPTLKAELIEAKVEGNVLRLRLRVTPTAAPTGLLNGELAIDASGFRVPLHVIGRVE